MLMVAHWGSRFAVVQDWGVALFVLAAAGFVGSFFGARRLKLS
jgi:hypothetical protein